MLHCSNYCKGRGQIKPSGHSRWQPIASNDVTIAVPRGIHPPHDPRRSDPSRPGAGRGAPHPVNLTAAILNHVSLVLTTLGFLVAWREEAERELRKQASTDGLVEQANLRTARRGIPLAVTQASRSAGPAADRPGSLQADQRPARTRRRRSGPAALRHVLHRSLRRGEEFCVLSSRAGADAAEVIDRRLRDELASAAAAQGIGSRLSFSAGLAVVTGADAILESIVQRADEALYKAKNSGRGRMVRA
jgi:hypothetical protein